MSEFVVIGLGLFGRTVAIQLTRSGHSVLAVDSSQEEVDRSAAELDNVVCVDATDQDALHELGLERMSCAVVAIGAESMEASILATAVLRQMGVPQIVARSLGELHARVLRAVGAHQVVSPEEEMGARLARRLGQPNVLERVELGDDAEIAEMAVPAGFVGKNLVQLDVRRRFHVSVVAVRRNGQLRATLSHDETFEEGDILVVIGTQDGIAHLAARL